ncbi:MAG TPA: Rieske 2Fe-2S domain-containing protein [Xanthobacteraceae bacterium]|nr:Rieske 2Fe-2S domain-containing protein [Xanthobacteraceae bacterium]
MFSKEDNETMTRTSPGTKAGAFLRQYWQPVAMISDLLPNGAPLPIKVMDEDLVLFRDEHGRLGLLGLNCAHRGADLSYGRVEGGGLRCIYHGWVFDVNGQCLEQPAEPRGKTYCQHVKHLSYPVTTGGGMVFAYMGEGEPPVLPQLECLTASDEHLYMWRFRERCNYLQGLEGDIDPFHLNFLHRAMVSSEARDAPGSSDQYYDFYMHGTPRLEVEQTRYGLRIFTMRDLNDQSYLRVTNFMLPNVAIVAGPTGADGYTLLWHVPVTDDVHIKYMLNYKRSGPINREAMKRAYDMHIIPGTDLEPRRSRENRWLQNREEMQTSWYAGLGPSFSVHDNWVTESMGPIYDRSKERLGYSDMAVVAARRQLLAAIADVAAGKEPTGRFHDVDDARLEDLVVRSYLVNAGEDYKASLRQPVPAH